MADIAELADALWKKDLARVQACPSNLLRQRDACVPCFLPNGWESMRAAPLACAIDYALRDPRRNDLQMTADGTEAARRMDAFEVLDWFLTFSGDLEAPLDSVTALSSGFVTR